MSQRVCVCVCVCMCRGLFSWFCAYVYTFLFSWFCTYVYTFLFSWFCTYVYTFLFSWFCTCVYTFACTSMSLCTRMHVDVQIPAYLLTSSHIHIKNAATEFIHLSLPTTTSVFTKYDTAHSQFIISRRNCPNVPSSCISCC